MLPLTTSEPWCPFAHVCSQWRQIALDTPSLWSRLHVRYEDEGMEYRVTPMVREILSRTRSVPPGRVTALLNRSLCQLEIIKMDLSWSII
jgi:hypothetical protein